MVQVLQLSMPTTAADSGLRLDGAVSDSDAEFSGLGFSDVLQGMTQAAKNSPSDAKLRHVPAGISTLNSISQALLEAVTAGNSPSSAEDTEVDGLAGSDDDSSLTSSLLGQIALKDKLPETGAKATDAAEHDANGSDSAASANAETTADAETLARAAAQQQDSASEITEQASKLQAKVNNQLSADPESGNVSEKTAGPGTAIGEAQPVATLAGAADAESEVIAESAKQPGSESAVQNRDGKNSDVKATIATGVDAEGSNLKAGQDSSTASTAMQSAIEADADVKTAPADSMLLTATGTASSTVDINENSRNSADNSKIDADTTTTANKLPLSAATDKTDSQAGAKVGTEQYGSKHDGQQQQGSQQSSLQQNQQQNSQQGHKQNNNAQLPADRAAEIPDSTVATAKVAADTGAAARGDTAFNSALSLAEQRQQASPAQAVARPLAEQLKQSLNLMQQDAAGQLRERVSLMVRQNIQIAEIRLDPAGLGQMQIKIDMQQDQASVQFIVQQSQAKELLEQQLPRLREMLQQQGIQLTEGQVQQQSQQERQLAQRGSDQQGKNGQQTADGDLEGSPEPVQLNVKTSDRLVDYYA